MTLRTLNYGNYGIFLIMGNAGFCPSTVRITIMTIVITIAIMIIVATTIMLLYIALFVSAATQPQRPPELPQLS